MLKGECTIRPLRRQDVASIGRIHTDACRIAYAFMGWDYTPAQVRLWYAGKIRDWDWGRVASRAGRPVGFIAMTGRYCDQLFVHPDAQGQGIGSALLGLALGRGLRPVTLHVFEENAPARRFYERYGFAEAGRWFNEHDGAVELLYRLGDGPATQPA